MRISDWSSDVCSSDLRRHTDHLGIAQHVTPEADGSQLEYGEGQNGADLQNGGVAIGDGELRSVTLLRQRHGSAVKAEKRKEKSGHPTKTSEERRVGKKCDSTFRSGWAPDH